MSNRHMPSCNGSRATLLSVATALPSVTAQTLTPILKRLTVQSTHICHRSWSKDLRQKLNLNGWNQSGQVDLSVAIIEPTHNGLRRLG
jgi:hypothetical protein